MSGHLRFGFAAALVVGLSTAPASSNPITDFFSLNVAPKEATAPAPAQDECLPQPGKSTTDGQHWFYRFDGHRKCWFQAAEGTAMAKQPVHHNAAQQRVAAPEENEATPRKTKAVVDANAELLPSAPAETPQPTPPAPEFKMVDATPVRGATALVPPTPVVVEPATEQLTPDHPPPLEVDVETLLAAAPSASDTVAASAPPKTPVAVPISEASDEGRGWTATWLGALLMALGCVALLTSSRRLRRAILFGRSLDRRTEYAAIADHAGRAWRGLFWRYWRGASGSIRARRDDGGMSGRSLDVMPVRL